MSTGQQLIRVYLAEFHNKLGLQNFTESDLSVLTQLQFYGASIDKRFEAGRIKGDNGDNGPDPFRRGSVVESDDPGLVANPFDRYAESAQAAQSDPAEIAARPEVEALTGEGSGEVIDTRNPDEPQFFPDRMVRNRNTVRTVEAPPVNPDPPLHPAAPRYGVDTRG